MTSASDEDQARAYDAMTAAQREFQQLPTPDNMVRVLAATSIWEAANGLPIPDIIRACVERFHAMRAYQAHQQPRQAAAE